MPELVGRGRISRLSQCGKWLNGFSPELRVQMITTDIGDFYLYEPVQMDSEDVVIPVFFFNQEGVQMVKCLQNCMIWIEDARCFEFQLPEDPSFDSSNLLTIPASQLKTSFAKIEMCEGVYLKDHCSSQMYRM